MLCASFPIKGKCRKSNNKKYGLWQHTLRTHQGFLGPQQGLLDYKMNILSTSSLLLNRLLEEVVNIYNMEDDSFECGHGPQLPHHVTFPRGQLRVLGGEECK